MLIEDKILFNEIRNRNLKVYEALFKSYYAQLLRFAEGHIFDRQACEDIVQTIFINFWENSESIHFEKSVKSYLFQSVKNRCINYLRDLKIHDKHNLLYLEALLNQDEAVEIHDPEIFIQINKAMDQLPEQMGIIFKLKYLEGKKLQEIAQMNQISENTVKTQLLRAKDKLRKLLYKSTLLMFYF